MQTFFEDSDQLPWDGKLNYDYQLWIDSDIVFNVEKFYQILLMDKDIAAGWYCTEDGKTTSVAHWLEEDDFRTNGGVMNHETIESISKRKKPFTVDYTGFGWLLIKKGVFEHQDMPYPWFAPKMQVFESGEVQDMCGEDVSFCFDAKEAGFEIWCDPQVQSWTRKDEGNMIAIISILLIMAILYLLLRYYDPHS